MSAVNTYTATLRTAFGSTAAKLVRAAGMVPVTISRPGKASLHVQVDNKTAEKINAEVVHLAKISVDGQTLTVLRGALERHPLKDHLLHIDLVEVDEKSDIKVDVAVAADGRTCPGVKAGGLLEMRLRKVKVLCKAGAIPDAVTADVSGLQLMQTLYAKSLTLPAGVKLVTRANLPVVSVAITRGMKNADEAAAAPAAAAKAAPATAAKAAPATKK